MEQFQYSQIQPHTHRPLFLWQFLTCTRGVEFKWIHVHLKQLAYVKIPYLRTNKWTKEIQRLRMVCNSPIQTFLCASFFVIHTSILFNLVCYHPQHIYKNDTNHPSNSALNLCRINEIDATAQIFLDIPTMICCQTSAHIFVGYDSKITDVYNAKNNSEKKS